MTIAVLVHFKRNPLKHIDEKAEKMAGDNKDAGEEAKKVDDISIENPSGDS